MAVAQNTVIIDDVEYKPGEQLPELGSIHRVFKDGGKRHYQGLAKDSDKLPLYVANNSSCFMTDTGEYYKFDESKKLWYKPDKIEQSKVTPIEVYGVLDGKIHQVSEDVEGIATPLLYKGSVSDISQLPLSPKIGWMYNISEKSIYGEAGMNVAWTGEIWDTLGPAIDMAPYLREDSEIITSLKTKTENLESANYTDRGTLADTDAFLINDGVGMKKSVLSKLSDFVLNKIADKVFAKLQTNDKTILGAINELNSKWLENIDTIQGSTNLEEFKPTAGEKAPRIYKIQGAVIEGISNEKFYGVLILLPVYNIQILIVGGGITYARDYTGDPLTWTTWKKYNYTVIK